MRLDKLTIGHRLGVGFGAVIVLMIVIVGVVAVLAPRSVSAVAEMRHQSEVVTRLKDMLLSVRAARSLTWYYVATGDEQALRERDAAFATYARLSQNLQGVLASPEAVAIVKGFTDDVMEFQAKATRVAQLKSDKVPQNDPTFATAITAMRTTQSVYAASNDRAARFFQDVSERANETATRTMDMLKFWSNAVGALGILIGGVCAWLVARSITRPITSLASAMRRIADGDMAVDVPSLAARDEVGVMAAAVELFKKNGLKLRATEAESVATRQTAERDRAANEVARVEIQRQQEAVVAAVAAGLDRLSQGDLTGRLNTTFSADYEKLRADFNMTAESLQAALGTIVSATNGIGSGSEQIAQASDDLSRRTEQQAASLEETAAALNVLTGTVKTMATDAGDAAKVVVNARTAAESSGAVVQQAVEAMGLIKDSSRQITNIIGVIDEIAFQTNLLALNAGVEAARAGEAGRGFAVVASEVRGLAQRSAEAAKEIKALISASTVQVESGVILVDKTGAALKDIIAKVAEIDTLVRRISASSHEQATGLAEINTAIGQMDQIVQQNAAMVEESTAAAHALRAETQDLSTMVGRFEIGHRHDGAPGNGRQAGAGFTKPTRAKANEARPSPRPVKRAVNAAAPRVEAARDGWDEF